MWMPVTASTSGNLSPVFIAWETWAERNAVVGDHCCLGTCDAATHGRRLGGGGHCQPVYPRLFCFSFGQHVQYLCCFRSPAPCSRLPLILVLETPATPPFSAFPVLNSMKEAGIRSRLVVPAGIEFFFIVFLCSFDFRSR